MGLTEEDEAVVRAVFKVIPIILPAVVTASQHCQSRICLTLVPAQNCGGNNPASYSIAWIKYAELISKNGALLEHRT